MVVSSANIGAVVVCTLGGRTVVMGAVDVVVASKIDAVVPVVVPMDVVVSADV